MKRICLLFAAALVCASCASAPKSSAAATGAGSAAPSETDMRSVLSEVLDLLQRPLGFKLSPQLRPIGRRNWEYHMMGVGWWDIYLMSGKKLGNGLYERTTRTTADGEIIELHNTKSQFDTTVTMVEIIFVTNDRTAAEDMRNGFHREAARFFGNQGANADYGTTWEAGYFSYTSYHVQRHEDGKWIYLVSSLDYANSTY